MPCPPPPILSVWVLVFVVLTTSAPGNPQQVLTFDTIRTPYIGAGVCGDAKTGKPPEIVVHNVRGERI